MDVPPRAKTAGKLRPLLQPVVVVVVVVWKWRAVPAARRGARRPRIFSHNLKVIFSGNLTAHRVLSVRCAEEAHLLDLSMCGKRLVG